MIDMWAITMTFPVDPMNFDTMVKFDQDLGDLDPFTANIPDEGVSVTVYEGGDPIKAADLVREVVSHRIGADPVSIEIEDEDLHAQRAEKPTLPEMVSAPEVGEILGVTRQRVYQLQHTAGFPEPLYRLRTGPIWDATAVEAFARTWDRRPGPKARAS